MVNGGGECVTSLSNDTKTWTKPITVEDGLWKMFTNTVDASLDVKSGNGVVHLYSVQTFLIIVDDNMPYRSMRYEFCKLARRCEFVPGVFLIYYDYCG